MNKTCFRCHETKSIDAFYGHPKMADGHLGKCIECTKREIRERAQTPSGRKREHLRNQKTKRKKDRAHYQRTLRAKFPERYRARNTVDYAVKKGTLIRLPCEVCGDPKSQAHHDDYSQPLAVRWLCFKHHREVAHGQIVG